jgi:hypothetical protein
LAVCEVLLETCLLHLFTSWKSSWVVDSTEVLFTAPLYPSYALIIRTAGQPSLRSVLPHTCCKEG